MLSQFNNIIKIEKKKRITDLLGTDQHKLSQKKHQSPKKLILLYFPKSDVPYLIISLNAHQSK